MAIAFAVNPSFCVFIACRMTKLSLDHGLSKDSLVGFLSYAVSSCYHSKEVHCIREAHKIAGDTILLLKRFGSSIDAEPDLCLLYYGYVAQHTEPWQLCTENLRKGFEGKRWPLLGHHGGMVLHKCHINVNGIRFHASQLQ
jgi:hypothetical protein